MNGLSPRSSVSLSDIAVPINGDAEHPENVREIVRGHTQETTQGVILEICAMSGKSAVVWENVRETVRDYTPKTT